MLVIDTNVLAYLLLVGNKTPQAAALLAHDRDWRSDYFVLVEFTNVLATNIRVRGLRQDEATLLLTSAEEIIGHGLESIAHADALAAAERFSVSAYDARFLTVADKLGSKLVTEDARLRAAAPMLTQSLAEALSAAGAS